MLCEGIFDRLFGIRKKGPLNQDFREPTRKQRILLTLGLVLLFRALSFVSLANVDEEKLHELLAHNPLLGGIDLFAGGEVLTGFSIVAVGLFPYLFAAGIVSLVVYAVPALRRFAEEKSNEQRLKRSTTAMKVVLAFVIGWGLTRYLSLESGLTTGKLHWLTRSEFWATFVTVTLVTLGSWLTDKFKDWITEHGIGPGEGVILIAGSSLAFVLHFIDVLHSGDVHTVARQLLATAVIGSLVAFLSIFLAKAKWDIPMTSTGKKKIEPRNRFRAPPRQDSLTLLANRGGTQPVSSALGFIALLQIAALFFAWAFPGKFSGLENALRFPTRPEHGLYWIILGALVILFTYLTNFALIWKPFADSDVSIATDLKRKGKFIVPGIRPGERTDNYISRIMARITLPAAMALAFLAAVLPYLILRFTGENVSVAVLAVIVFVKSFIEVRESYKRYDRPAGGYEGFLKKQKR